MSHNDLIVNSHDMNNYRHVKKLQSSIGALRYSMLCNKGRKATISNEDEVYRSRT